MDPFQTKGFLVGLGFHKNFETGLILSHRPDREYRMSTLTMQTHQIFTSYFFYKPFNLIIFSKDLHQSKVHNKTSTWNNSGKEGTHYVFSVHLNLPSQWDASQQSSGNKKKGFYLLKH